MVLGHHSTPRGAHNGQNGFWCNGRRFGIPFGGSQGFWTSRQRAAAVSDVDLDPQLLSRKSATRLASVQKNHEITYIPDMRETDMQHV